MLLDHGELALREIVKELVNDLRTDSKMRAALLGEVFNRIEGKVKDEIEHSGVMTTKTVVLRDKPEPDNSPEPTEPVVRDVGVEHVLPAPGDEFPE